MLCCFLLLSCAGTGAAQQRNDKLLNRPYADLRRWHLGFSVGMHTLDLSFTHNGFTTDNGETWFMEQPDFSPGFCVNGLLDVRLNDYFNVRFTPGMYFGNRVVKMHDTTNDAWQQQNIKSNYVVIPVDLKFSATRYHNVRPYLVGGVMGVFDVSKKRPREFLRLKSTDFMLTAGFGCDIYLPYFKLCPEIKFCFGLSDILKHERPDFEDDPDGMKFTNSLKKATTQMVVLSFYFE
ncbi:porin family protein [uncultured Muribaculum sp.]|uniref:type IX secretion/gliding motility protein PorT/SprT n=1 Tax=uncultured Muribaculum sp. TaxID=1918613 RepID=UPI002599091C|nr:porin family protein [uncultured Muribaculum sp.]